MYPMFEQITHMSIEISDLSLFLCYLYKNIKISQNKVKLAIEKWYNYIFFLFIILVTK